jgi:hypothetical protein
LGFGALALAYWGQSWLPYEWKIWLAERTTNPDLVRFSCFVGLAFVGTWRVTR